MAHLEKNNFASPLIAILFTLLILILTNPFPLSAQRGKLPAPPLATPPPTLPQPRPNPDASGIYHVGDGVTAPELIYQVEPEYSESARKRKLAATTTRVSFIIETDGHVRDVHVTKSCADDFPNKKDQEAALTLDRQAVKAASQYRFEPAQYEGKPVTVTLSVEISFQVFRPVPLTIPHRFFPSPDEEYAKLKRPMNLDTLLFSVF
jgi:TonB family protein